MIAHLLSWYAALVVVGLIGGGLAPYMLGGLPHEAQRGLRYPLGLLALGSLAWWLSWLGLVPFAPLPLRLLAAGLAVIFLVVDRRRRPRGRWRVSWRMDLLFLAALLAFALVRSGNPDIWGAEKFMDAAFLNGVRTSPWMPPHDPWWAGGTINYYYFGYVLAALLTHLSGVPFPLAYNLAVATQFALTLTAVAALGLALTRAFRWALVTAAIVCVCGNYAAPLMWFGKGGVDVFGATRVIRGTINEFPAFTFLWADLHPHLHALPYVVLVIAALTARVFSPEGPRDRRAFALDWALMALALGSLGFLNAWDVPIYATLALAISLLLPGARARATAGALLVGPLLYLPFYAGFSPQSKGLALVPAALRSELLPFVLATGLGFVLFTVDLARFARDLVGELPRRLRSNLPLIAGALLLLAGLLLGESWTAILLVILLLLAALRLWAATRGGTEGPWLTVAFLTFVAAGVLAGCEFIAIRDFYGGDMLRMNTVFKFHFQAWVLLGVSAGVWLRRTWRTTGSAGRQALLLLAAPTLVFPLLGPWVTGNWRAPSLDGLRHMERYHRGDRRLVAWIEDHLPQEAVIAEVPGRPYDYPGRLSANTGRSTVVGWTQHEALWRNDWAIVRRREEDVNAAYEAPDWPRAERLLRAYGVEYIAFGETERQRYGSAAEAKFAHLPHLFDWEGTRLYRVEPAVEPMKRRPSSR